MDVQGCSFVAVFDSLRTTKGYIQMKGRARQRNAKFCLFRDEADKAKSQISLLAAQEVEQRVNSFIESKSRSRVSEGSKHIMTTATAGSSGIAHASAKGLVHRYALSVPIDRSSRKSQESLMMYLPTFNNNTLVLPSHLPNSIRVVNLPDEYCHRPRKDRHQLLSLMACVRLHSLGLLNERLLPLTRNDMYSKITKSVKLPTLESVPAGCYPSETLVPGNFFLYPVFQNCRKFEETEAQLKSRGHSLAVVSTMELHGATPSKIFHHSFFGSISLSLGAAQAITCSSDQIKILSNTFILLMNERWRKRSRQQPFSMSSDRRGDGAVSPYLVGIISDSGVLDWDMMEGLIAEGRRSKQERKEAVVNASTTNMLGAPRRWTTLYNETASYLTYGPSGETCGAAFRHKHEYATYHEYYSKVYGAVLPMESPLFDGTRVWTLPSAFTDSSFTEEAGAGETQTELPSVKLPQMACMELPLANAHIYLLTLLLPQMVFLFERHLTAQAFLDFCEKRFPTFSNLLPSIPINEVMAALTTKSCLLDSNYEKLEWFGDAVLKMVQTDCLLKSTDLRKWIKFLHEGHLTKLRSGKFTRFSSLSS